MSLSPTRKSLLIGASILGAIVVVAAIAIPFLFLPLYAQRPADVLPANTVALFEDIGTEEINRWSAWFPVLASLELPAGKHTVAVLELSDGRQEAARFLDRADAPEDAPRVGPFAIELSTPALGSLFSPDEPKLSATAAYRDAATHRDAGIPFRFVPLPATPSGTVSDMVLQAWLLHGRTHAGITDQSGGTLLSLVGGTPAPVRDAVGGIPLTQGTVVCAANGAEAWIRLSSQLPSSEKVLLEGIAGGILEQSIGARVSLRFDVLPLADKEGCVVVMQTGTGGMHLALRATAADAQSASGAVARFESAFLASRTTVRVEERIFEETDFASRMIRIDAADIVAETENIGRGWTMKRWTEPDTDRKFVIALQDATVVVGTNEQAVRSLLPNPTGARNAQLLPNTSWTTGVVTGPLLERLHSGTYAPLLPRESFLWSAERKGTADFVTLRGMPADLTSEALDSIH